MYLVCISNFGDRIIIERPSSSLQQQVEIRIRKQNLCLDKAFISFQRSRTRNYQKGIYIPHIGYKREGRRKSTGDIQQ